MHMCSSISLYLATSYIDIHHSSDISIYIWYNVYIYMFDRQIDGLDKIDRVDKIDKVDKVDRVGR
jgi:hypothetical protein